MSECRILVETDGTDRRIEVVVVRPVEHEAIAEAIEVMRNIYLRSRYGGRRTAELVLPGWSGLGVGILSVAPASPPAAGPCGNCGHVLASHGPSGCLYEFADVPDGLPTVCPCPWATPDTAQVSVVDAEEPITIQAREGDQ